MIIKKLIINSSLIAASVAGGGYSYAAEALQLSSGKWHAVASAGLTFGGDELVEVKVQNGFFDDADTEDIKAGELFFFSGGIGYLYKQFQLQTTLGYYSDGIFGENGETTFTRWPIEILGFWHHKQFRLGAGITHHINPEFEYDIDDDSTPKISIDYDNATGFVLQGEYIFSRRYAVGLRYTNIEYKRSNNNNINNINSGVIDGKRVVDGDSVGIVFTYLIFN